MIDWCLPRATARASIRGDDTTAAGRTRTASKGCDIANTAPASDAAKEGDATTPGRARDTAKGTHTTLAGAAAKGGEIAATKRARGAPRGDNTATAAGPAAAGTPTRVVAGRTFDSFPGYASKAFDGGTTLCRTSTCPPAGIRRAPSR
jgi:hypothetical protein